MQYLVEGMGGPGFATVADAPAMLETEILPGFEAMMKMDAAGKIRLRMTALGLTSRPRFAFNSRR